MMVADVTSSPTFAVLSRKSLFAWRGAPDLGHANYDVAADGKLLMVLSGEQDWDMVVIRNWAEKIRAKVSPAKLGLLLSLHAYTQALLSAVPVLPNQTAL